MLLIGLEGKSLSATEREWLGHDAVSGVILFSRNFDDREQVQRLIAEVRACRPDGFLISVDQEGGPVQRFRPGFTRLPALARLGDRYDRDPKGAIALAEEHAWLMASEMRAIDIDLSFAPVVDLRRGNRAIGERAFHADPAIVSALGLAYIRGMHLAGMAVTIKHFPGHGSVIEDTHFERATDRRTLATMRELDLGPFRDAMAVGVEAVMMAHVAYPEVDPQPAGYSRRWIGEILRGELGFRGAVFSDDVGMVAAHSAGGVVERVQAHLDAGCDFVLVCQPKAVPEALAAAAGRAPAPAALTAALAGAVAPTWSALADNPQRARYAQRLTALEEAHA